MVDEGPYGPPREAPNRRDINPGLKLRHEDQTLAVYPAPLAPPPWPWPFPMDREAGIRAYSEMIGAKEHRRRRAAGMPPEHVYTADKGDNPVLQVVVRRAEALSARVRLYEFARPDGPPLPAFEAGAHIDVVVAPEFFRQYSLCGDPADPSKYLIAVLREDDGRGGSALMHRIFEEGRRVFISRPINHFPLVEDAAFTISPRSCATAKAPISTPAGRIPTWRRCLRRHAKPASPKKPCTANIQSATDALSEAGVHVDVKCADGLCGVCRCRLVSGEAEHRDFVLSNAEREEKIILCRSRAAKPGGVLEIDL